MTLFRRMEYTDAVPFADLGREIYIEGPIEYYQGGERRATAEAIYLDLVDGHGWIAGADARLPQRFGGEEQRLHIQAQWLRHSADGSLQADAATVTTCDFDVPHVHITTGDLRIRPTERDSLGAWEVELSKSHLNLWDTLVIPLPSLSFQSKESGKPIIETLGFGDSARFGSFVQATVNRDLGSAGQKLNKMLDGDADSYKASWGLSGSYLGSRGFWSDMSLELRSTDRYRLDIRAGQVFDRGADRGFIRVDEAERSSYRGWYRAEGHFHLNERDDVDLRATYQNDPGVQSEFWEREYVNYERRESFLQWRRYDDLTFIDTAASTRLEDFRTTVEERPSARLYRQRAAIGRFLGRPVNFRADISAANLRRREGDPRFETGFRDGLGDREVVRADGRYRLETPFPLPGLGVTATPYIEGVTTLWDTDATETDNPAQAALLGGLRLASQFWRLSSSGALTQFAPFAEFRKDFAAAEDGGDPVRFDRTEDAIKGDQLRLGLRGRWRSADRKHRLEAQAATRWRADTTFGQPEGWDTLDIFFGMTREDAPIPYGFLHDGRYELEGGETRYSLSRLGVQPSERLGFELGHQRGRDLAGTPLWETAGLLSRFRWTPKWELEGRIEISLLQSGSLTNGVTLRRFGHDIIFDLELSHRAGEGTSFNIKLHPVLGFGPSRIGVFSPW